MTDSSPPPPSTSPRWGATTKLAVTLTLVALLLLSLVYFRAILAPVLLSFILAFFFHPLVSWISRILKTSWRTSVGILYLLLLLLLAAGFTASGIALVQQVQSLVEFINRFITDLPNLAADLSSREWQIGPYTLSLAQFDLISLANQALNLVRPLLGEAGNLVSAIASGAASLLGWGLFVLLVSYYLLAEGGKLREDLVYIELPGYGEDVRRLGRELARTWDAFLRGQLLISLITLIAYSILLTVLGLRLSLAIASMAALARFVPWIGPLITWSTTTLVALFQTSNYFHLAAWKYALLIIATCILLDQILDNLVVPRLLGKTLGVHPAGILIVAIIATNLLGLVGLVLAAPTLATLQLVSRYVLRKLFDLDPWPEAEKPPPPPPEIPLRRWFEILQAWLRQRRWWK